MKLEKIDEIIHGIKAFVDSDNVYFILDYLEIELKYLEEDNPILRGHDALYLRSLRNTETILIKRGLPRRYQNFVVAHELGHAILHTDIREAHFSFDTMSKKTENDANYFAIKILNIDIDPIYYDGFTKESIAKSLYISEDSVDYIS